MSMSYPLRLETLAGDLDIHIHETWVAMRFIDVERAKAYLPHGISTAFGMNPYSGKYNVHFHDEEIGKLEHCRRTVEFLLQPVLAPPVQDAV
jgi:hypothetical protein